MRKMKNGTKLFLLVSIISAFILSCSQPVVDNKTAPDSTIKAPKLLAIIEDNSIKLTITSQNDGTDHNYKVYRSSQNDISTKMLIETIQSKDTFLKIKKNESSDNILFFI